MRVAKGEDNHVLALELNAVTNAHNVELFGPTGGHASDGVIDKSASETMEGCLLVILALSNELSVFLDESNTAREHRSDFALGALDEDSVAIFADGVLDINR